MAAAVDALAQASDTSAEAVLLAAWKALLHRLGGGAQVRVAAAFDGRADEELRFAVGPFTEHLPLVTPVDAEVSFGALAARLHAERGYAANWQVSFDAEAVRQMVDGGAASPRLGFTFVPGAEVPAGGGVEITVDRVRVAEEAFALHLRVRRGDGGMELELHGGATVPPAQLALLLERYETLLADALARPHAAVGDLALMSGAERARVLAGFAGAEADAGTESPFQPVHARIAAQAARTPDAPAVRMGAETVSFAELQALAETGARRLRARGVGPETRVGIMLPASVGRVAAVLSVLRAGGAYVPLEPGYPAERLAFMVRDAGLSMVITAEALRERVPGDVPVVAWDAAADEPAPGSAGSAGDEEVAVQPASAAYVIYTSGSTGTPKGVLVEHGALEAHALSVIRHYGLGPDDRVLQFASFNFDPSIEQMLPPLAAGGCVVLRGDGVMSVEAIGALVEEAGITLLNLPTAQWHLLADEWARGAAPETRTLRLVIAGGEAMLPAYVDRWHATPAAGARLLNAYGPTETVVTATTFDVPADFSAAPGARAVSIGRSYGRRAAAVLDARLRPAPLGTPGELLLGGPSVARGYLGRPALTAERFVPDAFGAVPGARLYRTGDLARQEDDGTLSFLGRVDHQVKVRGFRIEPGEVEAALERHPAVREAVVAVREDTPGEKRLAAYVVAANGTAPDAVALRAHLLATLPEYMVPGAFVALDRLPLTPAGKVDRAALPAPEQAGAGSDYAAPRNATEELLAGIFAQVLKRDRVGIHDAFFELGGDSIISIQVVARARAAGLHLVPRQVFEHPTVAELAAVCGDAGQAVRAEQGTVSGAVELTPIQAWFLSLDFEDRDHFNLSQLFEVRRPVDAAVLERAVRRLVEHHDALRMRFRQVDGVWRQEIAAPEDAVTFHHFDLGGLDEDQQREALEAEATRLQAGLDLERGPLLRVAWFGRGPGRSARLLAVAHHLVMDIVSWRVLMEDLEAGVEQAERGGEIRLPEKTTSFQAWAARLAAHAREGGFDGELDFWTDPARALVPPLPETPAHEADGVAAGPVTVALDAEETRALLQDVPRAYRTGINDVLLAALARAVTAWTGGTRVLVDLEGHGREELFPDVDVSRTAGWFTTVYPVLLDLSGADGEAGALKTVKEQLRAVPHRGIGYGALRWLAAPETRARLQALPGAQVRFEYLGQLDGTLEPDSLFAAAAEPIGPHHGTGWNPEHPLRVSGAVRGGRLQVGWAFADTLGREAVEGVADRFVAELRALIAHCTSAEAGGYTPSDFPLARLGQAQLDRVVAGRRDVEDVYPLSSTQEGILFHALYAAPGEGMYVGQFSYDLEGELDPGAFARAWRGAMDRHPALRTGFAWEGIDSPVQVVRRGVVPPLVQEDWRGLDEGEREARRLAFLQADRARGFDLREPPLLRLALFRTAEERHHLVCTQHHLVLDGWSLPRLFQDVAALYTAETEGRAAELPPVRPYRDFVAWLQGRRPEAAERFWREALDGVAAPTPLGPDTPDAGAAGLGRETLRLAPEATARLEAAARAGGLTLNTVVQGAWALLLARHAGQDDVVFGATLSGRPAEVEGVEGIVGLFINTLPVRVRVPAGERMLPWLRGLQAWNLAMQEHQDTPLTQVQAWSQVPAGVPLFDSILAFQNYPVGEPLGRGLRVVNRGLDVQTNYPLALRATLHGGLTLHADYRGARFGAAAVARMLDHLGCILAQVADDADVRLGDVRLMGEDERNRVVHAWNATDRDFPRDVCLHERFAEQVRQRPDAPALAWGDARWTYAELDARANRLANQLVHAGVRPDTRAAVLMERGAEFIVSVLAVLKAGGCYVPLDPAYPAERLRLMLEDSDARVLVTHSRRAVGLTARDLRIVCLDHEADEIAGRGAEAPVSGATPDNLAYIVYTSGSTGRPKGVMVTHRNVVQLVVETDYVRLRPGDRVAQASNASFDALAFETWGALLNGATLVGIGRDTLLSPAALRDVLREERITTLYQTTALLNQLSREQPDVFATVREVLFGGQAVDADSVRRVIAAGKPERLLHMYGPTETTAWCSWEPVESVAEGARTVSVGRPTGNQRVYILDRTLQPAPAGVAGEAYVGGEGVVRGYLDRPGLTAERCVPDPFSGRAGARMYRTGDRLRWSADGRLEFVGRLDAQVKIRGFRIEPGEIESVLSAHSAVSEARVVVREDEPGEKRLVAYVVGAVNAHELKEHLGRTLPDYMVPSAYVVMESLPLTPVGKLDVQALPAPGAGSEGMYVAPRTAAEEVLAGIWESVLRVERVGIHDGFFGLGGHSLLATRLVSRVREAFGVELPLRTLFDHPTVAEMAEQVEALRYAGASPLPPVERVDRDGPLPLSFPQERLWFLDQAEDTGGSFTIPFSIRIEGESLDAGLLERAFSHVIARHEVLRTVLPAVDGEGRQVIHPPAPFTLPRAELRDVPESERDEELRRLSAEQVNRPYHLERGPLLRALLARTGEAEHVLLLNLHHGVFDAWSVGVLVRELTASYGAFRAGATPDLPPLPVQYADYAAWQRDWMRTPAAQEQLAYWKRQLAHLPTLDLSGGRPRPERLSYRGGTLPVRLGPALAEQARATAREGNVTLFMLLLAAYKVVLAHHARTRDLVVGADVAGRNRAELEPLIGFFVNELVLRTDLGGDPAFRDLLGRVRDATLDAYRHQDLPFSVLVRELGGPRDTGRNPLFQVMFGLNNTPRDAVELDGLRLSPMGLETDVSVFELCLYLTETPDDVVGAVRYRTECFDAATAQTVWSDFAAVLERACADPGVRLEALLQELDARRRAESTARAHAAEQAGRTLFQGIRRKAIAITPTTDRG
ncbi:MAG: amino acid adenylation domain-containing protein [Gemmatimonadetes bacterium]|nr:amino acid adenylation domain-containing protein [Gemmatimonadota bacterium]